MDYSVAMQKDKDFFGGIFLAGFFWRDFFGGIFLAGCFV